MIIKYSDNYESILYAIICHNVTGYFLVPKSQPQGLFEDEEYIDADKINKLDILNEHNIKFGLIKWLNIKDKISSNFKNDVTLALRFWHVYKYKATIDCVKYAIKYGLTYLPEYNEYKIFKNIAKQVLTEISLAEGYLDLLPIQKNKELFLLGEYNEESKIGDLILEKIKDKYFGYNLLLRTSKGVYMFYKNRILYWDNSSFDSNMALAKLLEFIYAKLTTELDDLAVSKMPNFTFITSQSLAFN